MCFCFKRFCGLLLPWGRALRILEDLKVLGALHKGLKDLEWVSEVFVAFRVQRCSISGVRISGDLGQAKVESPWKLLHNILVPYYSSVGLECKNLGFTGV